MSTGKFVLHQTKQCKGQAIYVYYMIAWYYRKNKKPVRHIIKHLGHLTPDEIHFYQHSVACLNAAPSLYPCDVTQLCVQESKAYLSCAVGHYFWEYWGLSCVFAPYDNHAQTDVSTADIAKILTLLRYVRPCSKQSSTALYRETCLPELTGVPVDQYNMARVFRALSIIESHREALGRHIFTVARTRGDTDGKVVYYDLSSGNITGVRCVMAKWGHCKDGYQTHVVLLLVITHEGYPIYWDVMEGNTVEVHTLQDVIATIERLYGRLSSVWCFDRGLVSDENLQFLTRKQIQFVTALDGSQLEHFHEVIDTALFQQARTLDVRTQRQELEQLLMQRQFQQARRNLFYTPIHLSEEQRRNIEQTTMKLHVDTRRYFLAFNPELAATTHQRRQERVTAFFDWVTSYNQELAQALGDRSDATVKKTLKKELKRRRLTDVPIEYTLHQYAVENQNAQGNTKCALTYKVVLKDLPPQAYERCRRYDGLWVLMTNMAPQDDVRLFQQTTLENHFDLYRLKQTIEESFRILSDFVELEPFHVYKSLHIKAHFTICILAYLLDRTILTRIRAHEGIANMDLHRLFHCLSTCKQDRIQLDDRTVVAKLTRLTDEQRTILKVLACEHLVSPEYLQRYQIVSDYENVHRNEMACL